MNSLRMIGPASLRRPGHGMVGGQAIELARGES